MYYLYKFLIFKTMYNIYSICYFNYIFKVYINLLIDDSYISAKNTKLRIINDIDRALNVEIEASAEIKRNILLKVL